MVSSSEIQIESTVHGAFFYYLVQNVFVCYGDVWNIEEINLECAQTHSECGYIRNVNKQTRNVGTFEM